eukprot:315781-Chlamydomonas_euryale.AAC.3
MAPNMHMHGTCPANCRKPRVRGSVIGATAMLLGCPCRSRTCIGMNFFISRLRANCRTAVSTCGLLSHTKSSQ